MPPFIFKSKKITLDKSNQISDDCAIIVLAAGNSSRMGEPKQLLSIQGKTLVRLAAQTALETGWQPVLLVTGAFHPEIAAAVAGLKLELVNNSNWQSGMAGSIRAGVAKALELQKNLQAVVLMVCDQPYVTPGLLKQLMHTRRVGGAPIVASAYSNTLGTPALFGQEVFSKLLCLEGEGGAKKLLQAFGARVARVEFPRGEIDIDTPADYTNFRKQHNE